MGIVGIPTKASADSEVHPLPRPLVAVRAGGPCPLGVEEACERAERHALLDDGELAHDDRDGLPAALAAAEGSLIEATRALPATAAAALAGEQSEAEQARSAEAPAQEALENAKEDAARASREEAAFRRRHPGAEGGRFGLLGKTIALLVFAVAEFYLTRLAFNAGVAVAAGFGQDALSAIVVAGLSLIAGFIAYLLVYGQQPRDPECDGLDDDASNGRGDPPALRRLVSVTVASLGVLCGLAAITALTPATRLAIDYTDATGHSIASINRTVALLLLLARVGVFCATTLTAWLVVRELWLRRLAREASQRTARAEARRIEWARVRGRIEAAMTTMAAIKHAYIAAARQAPAVFEQVAAAYHAASDRNRPSAAGDLRERYAEAFASLERESSDAIQRIECIASEFRKPTLEEE